MRLRYSQERKKARAGSFFEEVISETLHSFLSMAPSLAHRYFIIFIVINVDNRED